MTNPDDYYSYVFLEPHYGAQGFAAHCGHASAQNDMHPPSDVRSGEEFIRRIYETIRNSKVWPESAFILLFDEHGGFYDHVRPSDEHAPAPGDGGPNADGSDDDGPYPVNFNFDRFGVRVPALVISPLIPRGLIDHTQYDHTSVLATVERLFGLPPLTERDKNANDLLHLFAETTPRTDAPRSQPTSTATSTDSGRPVGRATSSERATNSCLTFSPKDGRWWLRGYQHDKDKVSWTLVGETRNPAGWNFGDTSHDPTWIGDFTGAGHAQVLFYSPGDGHWWLGSVAGGKLSWTLVGETRNPAGWNFGDTSHDPTWIGDFTGAGHAQVLFYSPGDGHWWLGSVAGGKLSWTLVGETRNPAGWNFGDTSHDPTWIGDFTGAGHAQVLFYSPGDGHWWLGSVAGGKLSWTLVGETRNPAGWNFGDTSHDPTWIGDFTGAGHAQVLFYSPGDGHWWLGSVAGGKLSWSLVAQTADRFTNEVATAHVGDFAGIGHDQLLMHSRQVGVPSSQVVMGPWHLGTFDGSTMHWSQVADTTPMQPLSTISDTSWAGDFTGLRRAQLLQYRPDNGQWPLWFLRAGELVSTTLRSRLADILSGHTPAPPAPSALLTAAYVANNPSNQLLVSSSADGRTWSGNELVAAGESSKTAPALAAFGNRLYLAFVANNSSNQLLICSSADGRTWTGNSPIGHESSQTAPSLAVFGNRLYVAYVANNSSNQLLVCSTADGRTWSGNQLVAAGESSKTAPALAAFGNRLYVAFVANNSSNQLLICSSADGRTWTGNSPIGHESSQTAPSLAVFGNRLYVAYVAGNSLTHLAVRPTIPKATKGNTPTPSDTGDPTHVAQQVLLACSTADGRTWSSHELVAGLKSSKTAPSLAAFGNHLHVAFVANNASNQMQVSSTADGKTWTGNSLIGHESSKTAPSLAVAHYPPSIPQGVAAVVNRPGFLGAS